MSDQHSALVCTLSHLLERSASARVFVVAAFHTGRSVLSNFLRTAGLQRLIPDDCGIQEYNIIDGSTRLWKEDRGMEDIVERKQWLIVARLQWDQKLVNTN